MLGRIGLRYKASSELKNTVQRMHDASGRDLPLIPDPWRVRRVALDEWAARTDREWAKNLGVAFHDQATQREVAKLIDKLDATVTPAPKNLRAHYDRLVAENEALRSRLVTCEAEVQRLTLRRGRPPKKSLQKGE